MNLYQYLLRRTVLDINNIKHGDLSSLLKVDKLINFLTQTMYSYHII